MTDYTSDEEHLIQHYRELSETVSGEASVGEQNVKVARRTLAKIKADAIREANSSVLAPTSVTVAFEKYADRIEQEAINE